MEIKDDLKVVLDFLIAKNYNRQMTIQDISKNIRREFLALSKEDEVYKDLYNMMRRYEYSDLYEDLKEYYEGTGCKSCNNSTTKLYLNKEKMLLKKYKRGDSNE